MLELKELILEQKSDLKDIVKGVAENKPEVITGSVLTLLAGMAAGHPELTILAPLAQEGVRRAFAVTAQGKLDAALKAHAEEEQHIAAAEALEAFLAQALGQLVASQREADQQNRDVILAALGGLRAEFEDFRGEFQASMPTNVAADVQIQIQQVSGHAIGVRVSAASQKKVWIGHQSVRGHGVGVDV